MTIAPNFSAFWSANVNPNKVLHVTIPQHATATLASGAITQPNDNNGARVVLYAKVNNGPDVALFPFTIGHYESATTDLFFTDEDVIDFFIKGAEIPVQISGQIFGDYSLQTEETDLKVE